MDAPYNLRDARRIPWRTIKTRVRIQVVPAHRNPVVNTAVLHVKGQAILSSLIATAGMMSAEETSKTQITQIKQITRINLWIV